MVKRPLLLLIGVGVLNLILFLSVFNLLQNEQIYHHTLGEISYNYDRIGGWGNYEINKVKVPFAELKNENYLQWDAPIYHCISKRMYTVEEDCYGKVRAAFFPLFPLLWKITNASPIAISAINYFLFVISVALLVFHLLKTKVLSKLIVFWVLISLPSTTSYYLPYTEALFIFTMTIAVVGLLKNKYWLYFIGMMLLAMVRPATVFVLFAILAVELFLLFKGRSFKHTVNQVVNNAFPLVLGFAGAIFIQYLSSGSWTILFDAGSHWAGFRNFADGFTDWSVEGFGLSAFALFYVVLPCIGFVAYSFFMLGNKRNRMGGLNLSDYLLFIAVFYFLGITAFSFWSKGADLHSLSRFILASPLFYLVVILLLNKVATIPTSALVMAYSLLTLAAVCFLYLVEYGGDRFQFPFAGMYLFVITGFFLLLYHKWPRQIRVAVPVILILLNTVWNTYLLNVYLNNAWIFI